MAPGYFQDWKKPRGVERPSRFATTADYSLRVTKRFPALVIVALQFRGRQHAVCKRWRNAVVEHVVKGRSQAVQ